VEKIQWVKAGVVPTGLALFFVAHPALPCRAFTCRRLRGWSWDSFDFNAIAPGVPVQGYYMSPFSG
jgi:hypothetical protein